MSLVIFNSIQILSKNFLTEKIAGSRKAEYITLNVMYDPFSLWSHVKHTLPDDISMTTQPTDQMSAALPCPSVFVFMNTSGAIYATIKHSKL